MSEHLHPSAREYLLRSDEERIERILRDRWITYPKAEQILENLEWLLVHPKKSRMPNLLIIGDTNNGKTALINHFLSRHPVHENAQGDHVQISVFAVQAPPTPHEGRFYDIILDKLNAPARSASRRSVGHKLFQVLRTFRTVDLRLLIIDEVHHILAGDRCGIKRFLQTIKYIGNELRIPIVGVGTKEAQNAIGSDLQLANRFEPAHLPRWDMGNEFRSLLGSFERLLPLKKRSGLANRDMAGKLFGMIDGSIGSLSDVLSRAAVHAIKTKSECITIKMLDSIHWVPPSDRRYKAI